MRQALKSAALAVAAVAIVAAAAWDPVVPESKSADLMSAVQWCAQTYMGPERDDCIGAAEDAWR